MSQLLELNIASKHNKVTTNLNCLPDSIKKNRALIEFHQRSWAEKQIRSDDNEYFYMYL